MEMGDSIVEGHDIKVVDTVGAGDSFTAAVATGLCLDMPLNELHHFASNAAAHVCGQAGATPALPSKSYLSHIVHMPPVIFIERPVSRLDVKI